MAEQKDYSEKTKIEIVELQANLYQPDKLATYFSYFRRHIRLFF